jgi:tRNA (guanine-N7-)-methyltransferase
VVAGTLMEESPMTDESNRRGPPPGVPLRTVRSFVRRQGRMTLGQSRGMEQGWPRFGLSMANGVLDIDAAFGRAAPVVFEIGFGMGQSLAEMAKSEADRNFIGVEVHRPGIGRLLAQMLDEDITNIRLFEGDARDVLGNAIADASLDRIQIYFPDPWHKTRHHKRRLIQPEFVRLLVSKLKPQGLLHLATDWEPYARQMLAVLSAEPALANTAGEDQYAERPDWRPLTKFEARGQGLGHGVWDLLFRRR